VDFLLDQNNLLIVFVALASGVMLMLPNLLKGGGKTVGIQEAVQLANQSQGIFLDVRSQDAYKTGSIPQARNVPAADINSKLPSLPKDKPIIIVCDQGRDSTRLAGALRKQGYTGAVALDGGLKNWLQAGLPLSRKT